MLEKGGISCHGKTDANSVSQHTDVTFQEASEMDKTSNL